MNKYLVEIPITGVIQVEVEANNEKDAIDKYFNNPPQVNTHQLIEYCTHEKITSLDEIERLKVEVIDANLLYWDK